MMNKRQLKGKMKTLAHNVMNNMQAHLELDIAFHEQAKKLGVLDWIEDRLIIWKIDVEINGVKYIGGIKTCHWSKKVNSDGHAED